MSEDIVTQTSLRRYARIEVQLTALNAQVKELEQQQSVVEVQITKLLETGATVEPGRYSAVLNSVDGRRSPPWKDLYLTHMVEIHDSYREHEENRVLAEHPAKKKIVLVVTGPVPKKG